MTRMMIIFILTSLVIAALDIEAAVRRDEGPTVIIMLLNKDAFLSFLDDILKKMLIYLSRVELAFSSQPK